jgi:hypothetical protein
VIPAAPPAPPPVPRHALAAALLAVLAATAAPADALLSDVTLVDIATGRLSPASPS